MSSADAIESRQQYSSFSFPHSRWYLPSMLILRDPSFYYCDSIV
jgi:hypothetical protein